MIELDSRKKELWDILIVFATVVAAVEIPFRLAFDEPPKGLYFSFEVLLTILFSIDIVLSFFVKVKTGTRMITDPGEIRKRYLRGWFVVDVTAAFPFFLLMEISAAPLIRSLRLFRAFQLMRLLKLSRVANLVKGATARYGLNPGLYRLLFFVFFILLASHWIACGWIILGGVKMGSTPAEIYSYAFYWAVTTLTTVGYGDITPETMAQRYYTVLVMFGGVGTYGYVIGNVASFLANVDVLKAGYRKKVEEISAFLSYRNVPIEMQKKVQEYYEHLWESRMGHDEEAVLEDIPEPLKTDLALYMRHDLIRKVPFLADTQETLVRELVMALQPHVYLPDTYIIQKGETGSCMYIVSNGQVEVVSDDGKEVYAQLGEGSFVGEMALILDQPRTASVRTRGYCDLYLLEKKDFDAVLEGYPGFKKYIKKIAEERLEMTRRRQDH